MTDLTGIIAVGKASAPGKQICQLSYLIPICGSVPVNKSAVDRGHSVYVFRRLHSSLYLERSHTRADHLRDMLRKRQIL